MVKIECSSCGAQIEENNKFCTDCGTKIEKTSEKEEKEIICPKCSKKLSSNIKFCTDCGTKMGQPVIKKSPSIQKSSNVSSQKSSNDPVDETIESLKETGKDLLKEANSLFKKFR